MISLFLAFAALGRILDVRSVNALVADSELTFIGRVKSVNPSGITTHLSYPTWEKCVFEWLQVEVEVLEPIKGTTKGQLIPTAMLAVDESKGPRPMLNAPGMLEPKTGELFLLFLERTTKPNLFASLTAPFDDDQAIFKLDRRSPEYTWFHEGKEGTNSPFLDRHKLVWSLIDDTGALISNGVAMMRSNYAREIRKAPSTNIIYLEWVSRTNAAGWFADFPKELAPPMDQTGGDATQKLRSPRDSGK
jgi:hypothetical protein